MTHQIEDLYTKANEVFDKYQDAELRDFMLGLAQSLQMTDAMYHHFGYLVMHVRATVAHQSRPAHLQEAIERAQQVIKRYEERNGKGIGTSAG
jgi:hypothetical protein